MSALRCDFWPIYGNFSALKNDTKKQLWWSEILQEAWDVEELHIKNIVNFRCEFWLIYGDFSGLEYLI